MYSSVVPFQSPPPALTANRSDWRRFLLQKRLVVRQYKYVLYLQQMTYVLVLVLFCKSELFASLQLQWV
eukprot:COSAG02_NODE_1275_length_13506_cov_8.845603_10_plen_69_part_00